MNEERQAKEIFNKFNNIKSEEPCFIISENQAKQCAEMCVDEVISIINKLKHPMNSGLMNRRIERKVNELKEVKKEISTINERRKDK
ncbi:MAG: hypothetical protein GY755_18505 [Chloroflexi bacterium]|nr:hypothetical protein [Chloroflexota bacterium]